MLEITVLGCGSSLGVPVIGCECIICNSDLIYNKRSRCAIIIKNSDSTILIDFGFEIREQLIKAKIKKLDAAILTHYHADHAAGIDNLRAFYLMQKKTLPIITDHETGKLIEHHHGYLFNNYLVGKYTNYENLIKLGSMEVQLFKQYHGTINSLGIRIGNFAYTNDVSAFPQESERFLYNLDTWMLDCGDYLSNSRHIGLDKVLSLNNKYSPKKIFLTNLSHRICYNEMIKILPKNISPLYDGCVISI